MRDWKGKRYWVVGDAEGLGREVALALSRLGVEVILSAGDAARVEALAAEMPGEATALPLDLADSRAVAEAGVRLGPVDGLVYLGDLYTPMSAHGWDAEKVVAMAEVNFVGALRALGAAVPGMVERDRGHVVLLGSVAGVRGLPGAIGYGASKAAIMSLAESLRADLWRSGVTVQLVVAAAPRPARAQAAAQAIIEHMGGGGFVRNLPVLLSGAVRGGRILPEWAWLRLVARRAPRPEPQGDHHGHRH